MKIRKIFKSRGFTLLEIVLSTVLITIGVTAVVRVISTGIYTDNASEGKIIALNYAVQKMEDLLNTSYSSLSSSSDTPTTGFTRTWTITDNTNYKTLKVTVSWYYKRVQMSVNLASYLANVTTS